MIGTSASGALSTMWGEPQRRHVLRMLRRSRKIYAATQCPNVFDQKHVFETFRSARQRVCDADQRINERLCLQRKRPAAPHGNALINQTARLVIKNDLADAFGSHRR